MFKCAVKGTCLIYRSLVILCRLQWCDSSGHFSWRREVHTLVCRVRKTRSTQHRHAEPVEDETVGQLAAADQDAGPLEEKVDTLGLNRFKNTTNMSNKDRDEIDELVKTVIQSCKNRIDRLVEIDGMCVCR